MSRPISMLAVGVLLTLAPALMAQTPGGRGPGARVRAEPPPGEGPMPGRPMPGMGGVGGGAAEQLLARTGELKLSDQQVTRLAAIARRSAERRQSMRRTMDSLVTARRAPRSDSTRMGPPAELPAAADHMRDQSHADLRDALAVLTPDQLATAWEAFAGRRMGPRLGFDGVPGGPMGGAPRMRARPWGFGAGIPGAVGPAAPAR